MVRKGDVLHREWERYLRLHSFQIDLFIRQQREKEAYEQRAKALETVSPHRNQRPSSLELDRATGQMSLVRSASLNIQLSSIDGPVLQNSPDCQSDPSPTGTETEDIQIPNPAVETKEFNHDHNHVHERSSDCSTVDGSSGIATSHSQTVTAV